MTTLSTSSWSPRDWRIGTRLALGFGVLIAMMLTMVVVGLLQLSSLPPLSLYVHLPWCLRKCPYCDFNSHEPGAALSAGSAGTGHLSAQTEARYLDALFPVWLLSTSWRGENYLFAMNGQTGKFVGDLPVDKGAARKWMLGLTAALSAASYGVMWLLWLARIL